MYPEAKNDVWVVQENFFSSSRVSLSFISLVSELTFFQILRVNLGQWRKPWGHDTVPKPNEGKKKNKKRFYFCANAKLLFFPYPVETPRPEFILRANLGQWRKPRKPWSHDTVPKPNEEKNKSKKRLKKRFYFVLMQNCYFFFPNPVETPMLGIANLSYARI